MLLYHPFFDVRHCVFRMLRLLEALAERDLEVQRLRIWDFYLLFPEALLRTTLPQGHSRLRKLLRGHQNRYDVMPDAKRAFARLEPIQEAALQHLAAIQLVDVARLRDGFVQRTAEAIPEELANLIHLRNAESHELIEFLTTTFFALELYGPRGVRERSDLFDHRYDLSRASAAA
jgi:hypothetical protein